MQAELQENENLQLYHEVILNLLKHGSACYFFVPWYESDSDDEQTHFYVYESENACLIEKNFL